MGVMLSQGLPRRRCCREGSNFDLGVIQQQSQQFTARKTGRTRHRNFNLFTCYLCHTHNYTCLFIWLHIYAKSFGKITELDE